MTGLRILLSRVRGLFGGRQDSRIAEEIAGHIEFLAAENLRRGMTPEEARMAARRQFGGVAQIAESYREQRRLPLVDHAAQDLAYALRQLRKAPVFAAAAVLTLALGIGANTAVFRGLDAFLLRPLPVRHPQDLALLQPEDFGKPVSFTYPVFRDMAARQDVAVAMIAGGDVWSPKAAIQGRGKIKLQSGRLVSGNYFRVLGVEPVLGRMLAPEDDQPDAPGVAVLSFRLWQREFAGSPEAVGKTLEINSVPLTIVGVAPRQFSGERVLFSPELWLPLSLQPRIMQANWLKTSDWSFLDVMARLQPGVSMARAQAALDALYRQLTPRESGRDRLLVKPGSQGIVIPQIHDSIVEPLAVVMAMVGLLLLIASCNLANLLLARGAARSHELGVRLALGAGRPRLVRQLLTESLLLSGIGTALGIGLAEWCTRLLIAYVTDEDLRLMDLGMSWRVLVFAAAVSVAVTCLIGVVPALAGSRLDIRSALQANWRSPAGGRPRQLLGKAFVAAQVSVCLMLLSGAALLGRSLWNLDRQDWGFRREGLLLAELQIDMARDLAPLHRDRSAALRQPLLETFTALAGVRSAALSSGGPLGNQSYSTGVSTPARPAHASDSVSVIRVSPRYFETMGITTLTGRGIGSEDQEKAPLVAVLGETAARRFFDGADPVGRYISFEPKFQANGAIQVVGVARDVRFSSPREEPGVVVFVPLAQQFFPFNTIALRTEGDPGALANSLRAALQAAAPDLAVSSMQSVAEMLDDKTNDQRIVAILSAVFGGLALAMASLGLYGVISYAVERRTQEMGIRLALGASSAQVAGLVMREVAVLLGAGIALGGCASLAGARVLRAMLFGITARDSSWPVLAALVLLLSAAAAAWLPARRAARLNLIEALREE